jgi:hypothetical protein
MGARPASREGFLDLSRQASHKRYLGERQNGSKSVKKPFILNRIYIFRLFNTDGRAL